MNRRSFLKAASFSALASSTYLSACKSSNDIPIIDTHQHLWDLDLLPLEWLQPPLDKNFVTADYLKAIQGQNVTKAIYMEVGVPLEYKKIEAEWALELCEDPNSPTVGAVISANPTDKAFESYMRTMEGNPHLKGIRYGFNSVDRMLQAQVIENIRWLGKMGLSFDLNLNPKLLKVGSQLLDKCPETRFILNHCGNADPIAFLSGNKTVPRKPRHDPDQWYRDLELLARWENIICKISGIVDNAADYPLVASDLAPIVNHCIDVFGADRVVFASDWPVCLRNMSLARWIGTLKELLASRSLADRRKFFHDNAYAFYHLDD